MYQIKSIKLKSLSTWGYFKNNKKSKEITVQRKEKRFQIPLWQNNSQSNVEEEEDYDRSKECNQNRGDPRMATQKPEIKQQKQRNAPIHPYNMNQTNHHC